MFQSTFFFHLQCIELCSKNISKFVFNYFLVYNLNHFFPLITMDTFLVMCINFILLLLYTARFFQQCSSDYETRFHYITYICIIYVAQLFSTNAFSANTFSLNVLPSFTAIYSQSIVIYEQLLHILLSKKTNLSRLASYILGSSQ